jgi:hypothetical protein
VTREEQLIAAYEHISEMRRNGASAEFCLAVTEKILGPAEPEVCQCDDCQIYGEHDIEHNDPEEI